MSDRPDSGYQYLTCNDPNRTRNRGLLVAFVCMVLVAITYYFQ